MQNYIWGGERRETTIYTGIYLPLDTPGMILVCMMSKGGEPWAMGEEEGQHYVWLLKFLKANKSVFAFNIP
jgi:hypothetical protein